MTVAPGLTIVGWFEIPQGLGGAARRLVAACDAAGIPVSPVDVDDEVTAAMGSVVDYATVPAAAARHPTVVVCLTPEALRRFAERPEGRRLLAGRHVVGYVWWEVEGSMPKGWGEALRICDELWSGSAFSAQVLSAATGRPVTSVGIAVEAPPVAPLPRERAGAPAGFQFLVVADHASTYGRKNVEGAIRAYRLAFPEPVPGVHLLVKTLNRVHMPDAQARLEAAAGGRDDVLFLDAPLSTREIHGLIEGCDSYVALHRAEGFGLSAAEAMLRGKPVIATRYGGNLEYMTDATAFLVDGARVPISDGGAIYTQGHWMEPSVEQAADHMRTVALHPERAGRIAAHGPGAVRALCDPSRVGQRILEQISPDGPGPGAAQALPPSPASAVRARRLLERVLPQLEDVHPRDTLRRYRARARYAASLGGMRSLIPHARRTLEAAASVTDDVAVALDTAARARRVADATSTAGELALDLVRADRAVAALRLTPEHAGFEHFPADGRGVVYGYRGRAEAPPPAEPYADFQDLYRGSPELIRERQRAYVPLLGDGPVLDVGCGRGELLDVAREAGIPAWGWDLDPSMVERTRAGGHDVTLGSLEDALEQAEPESLSAIFCAQVVEHLPADVLWRLVALSRDRLRPGGRLIVETINPFHPVWLRWFWIDPTHRAPVHPELMLALCRIAGFPTAWTFNPGGSGHAGRDLLNHPDYALVAVRAPAS